MSLIFYPMTFVTVTEIITRRPASADWTAHRQFQATGQPVSRTQASDAMTSRLPRATRRSVCNAGASNGGPSLCVQISTQRSNPCQYIDTTRKATDCATTLRYATMFLQDVMVTVTLNILQSIFSTNNVSNVTGFPRIFNRNSIITKTQIVNLGAGI